VWGKVGRPIAGTTKVEEDNEFIYLNGIQAGNYLIRIDYTGKTPEYEAAPELYAGEFIGTDSTTGGNWGGRYGRDGYVLCNYYGEGKDQQMLPTYVKSIDYYRAFPKSGLPDPSLWAEDISDSRALAADVKNGMPRNAGGYTNSDQTMTVTIRTDGTKGFQVALYFVDWEKQGSRQAVEMFDAETLNLIAPVRLVKNHQGGVYLVYRYNKSVKFRIDKIRGGNISLSGIFFD
jgi:alpha-L-rhamnosidase